MNSIRGANISNKNGNRQKALNFKVCLFSDRGYSEKMQRMKTKLFRLGLCVLFDKRAYVESGTKHTNDAMMGEERQWRMSVNRESI